MRENAGQPAAAASLSRCRFAGCPAFPALRCFCIAACVAFCVALVPLGVGFSPAALPYVQKSEAHATVYNQAYNYLAAISEAAGLSVNDFVVTVGIGIAGTTGYNIFSGDVAYGADQTLQVLQKLKTTASWTDWESLSTSQKNQWGSEQNYHAAQFNSLLGCVGLADSRNVYYSSGGGDIDGESASIASQLGEIGNKWATGAVLKASEIYQLFSTDGLFFAKGDKGTNYGLSYSYNVEVDGNHVEFRRVIADWNASANGVTYNLNTNNWFMGGFKFWYSSSEVYDIGLRNSGYVPNGDVYITVTGNKFTVNKIGSAGSGQTVWIATSTTGQRVYWTSGGYGTWDSTVTTSGSGQRVIEPFLNASFEFDYIINGTTVNLSENPQVPSEVMPETPVGLTTDTPSYQPDGIGSTGITPETKYPDITGTPTEDVTPPYVPPGPDERPQNPYNPSDPDNPSYQSGTPEWKSETMENMTPILNIRLHALFPFSLIYDLQIMWDRLNGVLMGGSELGEQAVDDYLHIRIPVNLQAASLGIDYDEEMVLDLTHLRDLLLTIKPFMAYLLSFSLLMGLISFWRRILTGA